MSKTEKTRSVRIYQRPAVGWFSLRMLISSGIRALLSAVADSRTARREVLAALDLANPDPATCKATETCAEKDGSVWLDYVADLGDGFAATYTVAWLVARDHVFLGEVGCDVAQPVPKDALSEVGLKGNPDQKPVLPAGRITVFGGDLVYPYATQADYSDRTINTYYAARPWQTYADGTKGRALYTIPGNHDWYDGLATYVQNFCQPGRWHGGWQVQQRRSYFAFHAGHNVHVWGVDLATSDDFDAPQLDYFSARASELGEGETVLLCVPAPAWTDRDSALERAGEPANSWDSWSKIETIRKLVEQDGSGARVRAVISGDLHHYSRYETDSERECDRKHYITCGGGGAFMLGTYALPENVRVAEDATARKKQTFPDKEQSKKMRTGTFRLFYRHKVFCVALAAVLFSLVWLIQTASVWRGVRVALPDGETVPRTALDGLFNVLSGGGGFGNFFDLVIRSLLYDPPALFGCLLIAGAFIAFAMSGRAIHTPGKTALIAGVLHFGVQLCAALVIAALIHRLVLPVQAWPILYLVVMPGLCLLAGWLCCGLVFSAYLTVSNLAGGLHEQEIYSSQSIEDWKCFLRIKIEEGKVTIYPVGIRNAVHSWKPAKVPEDARVKMSSERSGGLMRRIQDPWWDFEVPANVTHLLEPAGPLEARLIERPIVIMSGPGDDHCKRM